MSAFTPVEPSIYSRERADGSLAYYVRFTREGRRCFKLIGSLEAARACRAVIARSRDGA